MRISHTRGAALAGATLLCMATAPAALACATCGCTLSGDAATGYSALTGWRINLQTDYIDQNQLRGGTHAAIPAEVINNPSAPALGGGEIERQTINRYLTLGISWTPLTAWNFNLQVPWVSRSHTTYGEHDAPFDAAYVAQDQVSGASYSRLGDAKIIVSWQGLLPLHNLGLQLGIKAPTGAYGTTTKFANGPAAGEPLDASLQAGTGSTDLILGAYWYQAISQNLDVFANGQFQFAVAQRQDQPDNDFKPGNSATVSAGLRYVEDPRWIPQLQVNLQHRSADMGALADRPDTAGFVVYISPGITLRVANPLHAYGFVQVPVYSRLDGYQLAPRWSVSLGLSYAF